MRKLLFSKSEQSNETILNDVLIIRQLIFNRIFDIYFIFRIFYYGSETYPTIFPFPFFLTSFPSKLLPRLYRIYRGDQLLANAMPADTKLQIVTFVNRGNCEIARRIEFRGNRIKGLSDQLSSIDETVS